MFSIETQTGETIVAGEARLVPVARSLCLNLGRGGLVWNRAIGLRLEAEGRETGVRQTGVRQTGVRQTGVRQTGVRQTMVPIRDRTRQLQLAFLGLGLVGSLILRLAGGRRRTVADEEMTR